MLNESSTLTRVLVLIMFIAFCLTFGAIGGLITATSVETWYQSLQKPSFTPPDWLFAPVWTILYILMAIAGWRIWRRLRWTDDGWELWLFALLLGLNLIWSLMFFGLRRVDFALVGILLLLSLILLNLVMFWRRDRTAGLLLLPYLIWVSYASLLNAQILMLNPI